MCKSWLWAFHRPPLHAGEAANCLPVPNLSQLPSGSEPKGKGALINPKNKSMRRMTSTTAVEAASRPESVLFGQTSTLDRRDDCLGFSSL